MASSSTEERSTHGSPLDGTGPRRFRASFSQPSRLGFSFAELASAQAPPPSPSAASPLTIDVQDAPALSPRSDLPQGPGATIVGTLEDGVGSQGSAVSGNTVVSSPNLTPTLLNQTASSVTVITAEQIQQRGQINVGEVLRSVPGIDVVRNSTPGSPTTIFIRGAGGEHTKVLVDGIPMNDPISPGRVFDFSNLSVDNIEKIEVIRGPQSVLYGSDAIGGVILITTKKGAGPMQGRASVMGGSFSTMNSAANVSGSRGPVYYSVGGSYLDTNGFSAASRGLPGNVEDDGFMLGTYSRRIGWQPSDNVRASTSFSATTKATSTSTRGTAPSATTRTIRTRCNKRSPACGFTR
ncbi:MAG: TonB-dependent receptor plug domain-containing protein [Pirellulales bacterium]